MERVEEIVNEYKELSEKTFYESRELILREYQAHREEMIESLIEAIGKLYMKAYEMQEYGRKEAVSIVCFFHLKSSLLTGSHKYLISLYDEAFYLDRNEVSISYCPEFISPYFLSDIKLLEAAIRKKYIRLKNYEMERVKLLHISHYHDLMKGIFADALGEIKNMPEYHILKKCDKPLFLYGGYRDYAIEMEESDAAFSNRG